MSSHASASPVPRRVFRVLRAVAIVFLVILLLPYVLAPLYRFVTPVSTLMLWRWVTLAPVERTVVPLEAVARALPFSVMGAEDGRFCTHRGIDWRGLRQALTESDSWSEARGGSTLTQQVAKNLFLWPGRSFVRKALELPLALWIDLVLPKRRIMEIYLNIAEWGPTGQFGAEAGARHAFGKSARNLTAREAALMAAILPNPHRRNAKAAGPGVRRLAGIYEARGRVMTQRAGCLR